MYAASHTQPGGAGYRAPRGLGVPAYAAGLGAPINPEATEIGFH